MHDLVERLKSWLNNYYPARSKSIYHLQYTYDLVKAAKDRIEELERWADFVRYNSKDAARMADDYIWSEAPNDKD